MLKKIQETIKTKFDLKEKKGLFISAFDKNGKLILSKGSVFSDKSLKDLSEIFYENYIKKSKSKIKLLVIDIVKNIIQLNKTEDILSTDIKKYGILIIGANGQEAGIMLPDIRGVADVKNALYLIKQKFDIKDKKVIVYKFETERFFIN